MGDHIQCTKIPLPVTPIYIFNYCLIYDFIDQAVYILPHRLWSNYIGIDWMKNHKTSNNLYRVQPSQVNHKKWCAVWLITGED